MKKISKISTVLFSAVVAAAFLTGCSGNNGSDAKNPFVSEVTSTQSVVSDASKKDDSSAADSSVNASSQTTVSTPESSVMPESSVATSEPAGLSIREVLDKNGGIDSLSQLMQSYVNEYMTVAAEYGSDDQIILNFKLTSTVDVNSAEGQQMVKQFETQMDSVKSTFAQGIVSLRKSYNTRPFTVLVRIANGDGTVLYEKEVTENDAVTEISAEPSAVEQSSQTSQSSVVSTPSAAQKTLKEVLDAEGGLSVVEQMMTQQLGTDQMTIKVEYGSEDELMVIMQLKQYVDMNSSQGKMMLQQVQTNLSGAADSVAQTIKQVESSFNVRPFTYHFVLKNGPGTVLYEAVISENGLE